MTPTWRSEPRFVFIIRVRDPDIDTGTTTVDIGATVTVLEPTRVVDPEVSTRLRLVVIGSRLGFVTDM
jgi:hypothetical protein